MTEIILQSPPPISLSSSPSSIPISNNDGFHQQPQHTHDLYTVEDEFQEEGVGFKRRQEREEELSLLAVWFTLFRKSLIACRSVERAIDSMEIGVPTNVRHVAHVTFDRFHGFLGLPVEFEPEVPRRPPSASTSVFGVSTESMQLSYDSRGNVVPTILLMMQRHLYLQGGLQAEGIFRINGKNGQEEYIRDELNKGVVPENIDIHCLAGLIKAWFRELPNGILDSLSPEQVMQAQSEEECTRLVRLLPSTEAALLDWAVNLMADVAQFENFNKMNARNVAMVFAPNMTQMADPLTALMYAVQVMNFLKTLVEKTLRDREDSIRETCPAPRVEPSDENGRSSSSQPVTGEINEMKEEEKVFIDNEPHLETTKHSSHGGFLTSIENILLVEDDRLACTWPCASPKRLGTITNGREEADSTSSNRGAQVHMLKIIYGQSSKSSGKKGLRKGNEYPMIGVAGEKIKGSPIASRLNSRAERVEAWPGGDW